ncbi:unnamed protein product [Leptosia nina]|uniref:RNA helicase n=1 Tax=Leptosia nina TaxID=320188 RepID=A0AAV1ISQ9_9NEOP
MTHPLKFDNVDVNTEKVIILSIVNNSNKSYILNKWIMLSKKRDSQINIKPYINQPKILNQSETIQFTIQCQPKFLGQTEECLVFLFKGFQLKRLVEINVVNQFCHTSNGKSGTFRPSEYEKVNKMRDMQRNKDQYIPGIRQLRTPNFVEGKIGVYNIPDKIWSAVLGDSDSTIFSDDYEKLILRLQTKLPCLIQDLNINNYCDKWHTLLYMEEIQANITIRVHDKPKAFLIRQNEYLALEINNLCETRPSLVQDKFLTCTLEQLKWYNSKLNYDQRRAVINILRGDSRPLPYIIFGPPGTGKTITVVETILQILKNIPDSRILVATPSNSASNLITERIIQYKNAFSSSIVRLIANYLINSDSIPDNIKQYCATLDIAMEGTSKNKHHIHDNVNVNCQKSFIGRHRVVVVTCNCSGALYYLGFPKGHFTHIIVDEAGQAQEPEIMIPLSFTDKDNGQIILTGDPMQLGPVILSKYCNEFGMNVSYLCRLLESYPYQKDYATYKDGFDDRVVTKLNENYRSLEEVLSLPSKMFYDNTLVVKFDKTSSWVPKIINATCEIFNITDHKHGGIYVYGIQGQNMRAADSPSWYNPQEASMVALTTCKLYRHDVTPDEIGIISPYIAQIKHLRLVFDAMGLPQPKIGTVEEFQGQERPIILITTVRSTESLIQQDIKHVLGFVKNPKRLNVAITRAQVSLILFCNPHLLCTDPLWNQVITESVKSNRYMGCLLPSIQGTVNSCN